MPFDNNQTEREIPMPKLKQQVFVCFRSVASAATFATARSDLFTLRQQSIDSLHALVMTFEGNPPMPQLG